ncbi:nucleotide exchange factor GrpE [Tautonia sp. JC769]|uniref:nucleotide exchange factor GrpE n=1 Tax=Tautonia sp. JC769 TaxID=3232135 RepID=UPI00345B1386
MTELSRDDQAALDLLRDWLHRTREEAESEPVVRSDSDAGADVGLLRLVEEFTALRHEVKLQTKGTRDLRDQSEALLPELRRAIEQFRSVEPKEQQAAFAAARPLAEALADLDEALDRARGEWEKARDRLVVEPARDLDTAIEATFRGQSWFARLRSRAYHEKVQAVIRDRSRWLRPALVDALIDGIALIQGGLHRVMTAERLERIATVGQPADPKRMTVVELADAPGVAPGLVVDEVRRGYCWRGRVLRFAEVRAARSTPPPSSPSPPPTEPGHDSGDDPSA